VRDMPSCRACGEEYDKFAYHIEENEECRETVASMIGKLADAMGSSME
jgi:recombinational DNA repair protein (RecF pathway)